jgi:hypothetical protein
MSILQKLLKLNKALMTMMFIAKSLHHCFAVLKIQTALFLLEKKTCASPTKCSTRSSAHTTSSTSE